MPGLRYQSEKPNGEKEEKTFFLPGFAIKPQVVFRLTKFINHNSHKVRVWLAAGWTVMKTISYSFSKICQDYRVLYILLNQLESFKPNLIMKAKVVSSSQMKKKLNSYMR